MGILVPPPLDHPDFERIMEGRLRRLRMMGRLLVATAVLGTIAVVYCLLRSTL